MWNSGYMKAVTAALGAVLVVAASAFTDNRVNADEAIAIGIAVVNAVTTYIIPNLTGGSGEFAKSVAAGALAVLTGLAGWLVGGMSGADWINLVIAFGTAAGVFLAPAPKHAPAPAAA